MEVFVTGGSGFIGRRLILKLVDRGYQVRALARSASAAATVESLGARAVMGDITEIESMVEGMRGCGAVFHVAGWYKYGVRQNHQAAVINIEGTRNVLSLAYSLGVPKIVYTSTVAVFGDTHGRLVDETFYQAGPFLTEYDRTKWVAHYEVAERLIEKGAPIVIVMPGAVYGPGDTSIVASLMRFFYRGLLPVFPSPGTIFTLAHVDDIAEGHILALEKGRPGECYLLTGAPISLSELLTLWAGMTGRARPLFSIPGRWLRSLAPMMGMLEKVISLPDIFTQDAFRMLEATYVARSDKARRELGWKPRPLLEGMEETLLWVKQTTSSPPVLHTRERQIAAMTLLAAMLLLVRWLSDRRKGK